MKRRTGTTRVLTLREVESDATLGLPYHVSWAAVRSGALPRLQICSSRSILVLREDVEKFINEARTSEVR